MLRQFPKQWPPSYPDQTVSKLTGQENNSIGFAPGKRVLVGTKAANAAWWSTVLVALAGIFLCIFFMVILVASLLQQNNTKTNLTILQDTSRLSKKISSANYTLTVNRVEKATEFQAGQAAGAAKQLVAFEVSIQNEGTNSLKAGQKGFSLYDEAGNKYEGLNSGRLPVLLTLTDIAGGKISTGWLTFEVPINSQLLRLEYQHFGSGSESVNFFFKV